MGSRSRLVGSTWKGTLEMGFVWLVQMVLIFCLIDLPGCSDGQVGSGDGDQVVTQSVVGCTVSTVRYPTTETEFARLYAGRGFLADDVHIGRDINLVEGTAIYPVACGTIRIYRAATGYGTLAVVIEHHLSSPIMVTNGRGETVSVQDFLSIYGHLRATSGRTGGTRLPWRDGDTVRTDQIIGYVQNDADNGDGEEHLHLGIRLQSAEAAARTDPTAWFAGNDNTDRARRRWYADPEAFLRVLAHRSTSRSTATWHPAGTVLSIDGQTWFVASEGVITRLPDDVLRDERLQNRVVTGASAEVACMTVAGFSLERTNGHRLVRFEGNSTVYEYSDMPLQVRYTFLAQQAFDSWGWQDSQIEVRTAGERTTFLTRYRDLGSRRLREGSLVKAAGRSDVYVVSQGTRRPIFDWTTFLALGYDESWIIEVDSSVLDVLAGPVGEVIRPEDLRRCRGASPSMPTMDAGVSPMDAYVPPPDVPTDVLRDVPGGVDAVIVDATVDAAVDVTMTPVHDCSDPPRDAGAPVMDAGVTMDLGSSSVRDAGVFADTGLDSGVATELDASLVPDTGLSDVGSPPVTGVPSGAVRRFEFRLVMDLEDWSPTEPYFLRDRYWSHIRCLNAGGSDPTPMVAQGDGWYRCDTATIPTIFVGTFFSPSHPTLGDRGHIATVDNWPAPCNPRNGIEWRISELPSGRELYRGPSSGLPCTNVGTQSRHTLP